MLHQPKALVFHQELLSAQADFQSGYGLVSGRENAHADVLGDRGPISSGKSFKYSLRPQLRRLASGRKSDTSFFYLDIDAFGLGQSQTLEHPEQTVDGVLMLEGGVAFGLLERVDGELDIVFQSTTFGVQAFQIAIHLAAFRDGERGSSGGRFR